MLGSIPRRRVEVGMSLAKDLEALRAGEMSFDRFATANRGRFRRWAGYFKERWPQRALDLEDLVQEGLLAAWRAVDRFDPTRGVTLERYVEYQVGRAIRNEIDRVLGWPDKRRGHAPVRPLSLDDDAAARRHVIELDSREVSPEAKLLIAEASDRLRDSGDELAAEVAVGIGLGMSADAVAVHLYDDPSRRIRYRFDSRSDAAKKVCAAAERAAAQLTSARVRVAVPGAPQLH